MNSPIRPTSAATFPQWIGQRAQRHGDRVAATFVGDDRSEESWTYNQLWRRVSSFAESLSQIQPKPQDTSHKPRALLLFPPGLEFITGFIGAHVAGWIPVPTCYPKPGRVMERLDSAASDCAPSAIIADAATLSGIDPAKLSPAARDIPHVATDTNEIVHGKSFIAPSSIDLSPDSIALLQYTSGSTSEPKGVMVRHRNVMANLEAIRRGFNIEWQVDEATEADCGVFWLPFFHDMGLIGGLLEPLYVGGRTVILSPRAFLQRPIRWLKMISDYKAVISGAPNFAYQLCVDRISPEHTDNIDLSSWKTAFCGAEPVLPRTISDFARRFASCGFSSSSFYPCYGLAEATLLAAGGDGPSDPKLLTVSREALANRQVVIEDDQPTSNKTAQTLVSCGHAAHETELMIVDSESRVPCRDTTVGEIWIRGLSVTAGYWNRDEENSLRFQASTADGEEGYCRTGDLGFIHDDELYITGRIKDVIILRGRNLFPQDIETTVRQTVANESGTESGQCAAFSIPGPRGEGLALVVELPRRIDDSILPEIVRSIRRAVIETHEVDPRCVMLVRQATVPLTSSGKVQRIRCREMFDDNEIKCKHRYDRAFASEQTPITMPKIPDNPTPDDSDFVGRAIETWLAEWLVVRAGVAPDDVELDKPFADYGLDSMTAVELSGEIEDWSGVELTPIVAWNHPTVAKMSSFIASELIGTQTDLNRDSDKVPSVSDKELEQLLDEIEQLPDEPIDHALADKPET